MSPDPTHPADESTGPTPKEVDAWTERERKRRQAWLSGPTGEEKRDWARGWRRRAALGLADSRLGPSPEEAEAWAERERRRRQTWLSGPTEDEKQDWAARWRLRALAGLTESSLPPSEDEAEAWAARERKRRSDWAAGPTPEEQQQWARREAAPSWSDVLLGGPADPEVFDTARRFLRQAELAGKGSFYALARAPLALWSYFVRSGRAFEEELYEQPPRRRVPF